METIIVKFIAGVILVFALMIGAIAKTDNIPLALNLTEIDSCGYIKDKISDYNKYELLEIFKGFYNLKQIAHSYNNMTFTEYHKDLYNRCYHFNQAVKEYFINHPEDNPNNYMINKDIHYVNH